MVRVFLLSLFVLSSMNAFSETPGTVGVSCYRNGKLDSVELLDLFEARANGLKIRQDLRGSLNTKLSVVTQKLWKDDADLWHLQQMKKRFRPIQRGSALELMEGHYPPFLPKDCKLEQITHVYSASKTWIDQELYNALDEASKVGVILHDYLFMRELMRGGSDSRYVRTIVGHTLSTKDVFEHEDTILNRFSGVGCTSEDGKTIFMATKIDPVKNIWKFRFLYLNAHQMFTSKTADFQLAQDIGVSFAKNKTAGRTLRSTRILKSKINPKETLTVESNNKLLRLSWKGTDPTDEFKNVEFRCGEDNWY